MVSGDIFLKHIIFPIVIVLIVLGNGALIHVLLTIRRRHSHQSLMTCFVIALATSDFLIGFPTMPLLLLAEKQLATAGYACMAVMCLTVSQTSASCLLLIAVGVERYVAILKPLHYQSMVTKRRAYLGIAMCWTVGITMGLLPFLGWNTLHQWDTPSSSSIPHAVDAGYPGNTTSEVTSSELTTVNLVNETTGLPCSGSSTLLSRPCRFPLVFTGSYVGFVFLGLHFPLWLILGSLYGRIMTQCRQQRKLICSLRSAGTRCSSRVPSESHNCSTCSSRKNYKIFRVLTMLVCYFILSWLPLALYYALIYHGFSKENLDVADLKDSDLTSWVYPVAVSLAYTNSAINPFLYGFGNRSVRRAWANTRVVVCLVSAWRRLRGQGRGRGEGGGGGGGPRHEDNGAVAGRAGRTASVSSNLIHLRCA